MGTKVRLYDLTHQLGLSKSELLDLCRVAGVSARSLLNTVTEDEAACLRSLADGPARSAKGKHREPKPVPPPVEACTDGFGQTDRTGDEMILQQIPREDAMAGDPAPAKEQPAVAPPAAEAPPVAEAVAEPCVEERQGPRDNVAAGASIDPLTGTAAAEALDDRPAAREPAIDAPSDEWAEAPASATAPASVAPPRQRFVDRIRGAVQNSLPTRHSVKRIPARIYLVATVLVGVVLGSFFVFVQPKNRSMAAARAAIRNKQTSLQLLEVEMSKLESSRRRVEQLEAALSGFENRLPRQGEIDVILREVWVIADAAGLKTQRIKTRKARDQDSYRVLPIEMSLRGPFRGLYAFLLSLERLPGTSNVESLSIESAPNEENGCVDASLVLNVFCNP